tara:strand:+ start:422 stop:1018 length:597 start_codon:yes stop_codon:yes gene_type:complete
MESRFENVGSIELPYIKGEYQMIPFDMGTLEGLTGEFKEIARQMVKPIKNKVGTAYLTVHGSFVKKGKTLRRPAPHTDGNYEPHLMSFGGGGGNGWKVGENGAAINTDLHDRQYNSKKGGIILATNYSSCLGWKGEFSGLPSVGGDCRHIELDEPYLLHSGNIYYGNNHFIHESIPVGRDIHRVFARVTLPEDHEYER